MTDDGGNEGATLDTKESEVVKGGDEHAALEKRRRTIMTGLTLGLMLASLDQTVVGTSLPRIVGELGGLERFSWLFSAYMLAATVMIPLAGKMSDRFGRKPVFLVGMAFLLMGSALSGLAQDMTQLILFRFVQGFGAGAMAPVAMATVADLYPPADRGKIQGSLGAVFGFTSIIGPFIGGYIVDNISWRWVFYVNLPVGIAAILVTMVRFPKTSSDRRKPVDYYGIAAITTALSAGLLVLIWGGTTYSWTSLEIFGLAALCLCALGAFIFLETRAEDPIIPLPLFRNPVFSLSFLALMLLVMGLFGVIAFMPMFLQAVVGVSATYSGQVLIPLMLTLLVGAIVSGVLLKHTGYKVWLVAGPLIAATGLFLMSTLGMGSPGWVTVAYLGIMGLGLGFTMSNYIVAVQNVIDRKDMGAATATITLSRSIGGTIGVTVLGVLVNRRMVEELAVNLPPGAGNYLPSTDINTLGGILMSPASSAIPQPIVDAIRTSLGNSIMFIFTISAVLVMLAWVATLFIKSIPLKDTDEYLRGSAPTTSEVHGTAGPASTNAGAAVGKTDAKASNAGE